MNGVFQSLEESRKANGACALALIDPDVKNDLILTDLVNRVVDANFDAILVGGSLIMDNGFEDRISRIRQNSSLPVIIFPGSSRQLSANADAVLFLSLLSGRNPQYLIGEQVESAPIIYHIGLEAISTGYILLDGGVKSSVQVMSNTNPLPVEKEDIIAFSPVKIPLLSFILNGFALVDCLIDCILLVSFCLLLLNSFK